MLRCGLPLAESVRAPKWVTTLLSESVLKRDRVLLIIALAAIVVVAAAYTLASVGMAMSPITMTKMAIEMPAMAMKPVEWSTSYALIIFLMWWRASS